MGLRWPSGLSEQDHEQESTQPQALVGKAGGISSAGDFLLPLEMNSFSWPPRTWRGSCRAVQQGPGRRVQGEGWQRELLMTPTTEQKWEARVASYQLATNTSVTGTLPSPQPTPFCLLPYTEPMRRRSLMKGPPAKVDEHPHRGRMWFTLFNQCPLLWSVGSEDPGMGKVWAGASGMDFSTSTRKPRTHPLRLLRSQETRKDWATLRPEESGEMWQLAAVWTGCQGLCNSNVPGSLSFWIWQMYCGNIRH